MDSMSVTSKWHIEKCEASEGARVGFQHQGRGSWRLEVLAYARP